MSDEGVGIIDTDLEIEEHLLPEDALSYASSEPEPDHESDNHDHGHDHEEHHHTNPGDKGPVNEFATPHGRSDKRAAFEALERSGKDGSPLSGVSGGKNNDEPGQGKRKKSHGASMQALVLNQIDKAKQQLSQKIEKLTNQLIAIDPLNKQRLERLAEIDEMIAKYKTSLEETKQDFAEARERFSDAQEILNKTIETLRAQDSPEADRVADMLEKGMSLAEELVIIQFEHENGDPDFREIYQNEDGYYYLDHCNQPVMITDEAKVASIEYQVKQVRRLAVEGGEKALEFRQLKEDFAAEIAAGNDYAIGTTDIINNSLELQSRTAELEGKIKTLEEKIEDLELEKENLEQEIKSNPEAAKLYEELQKAKEDLQKIEELAEEVENSPETLQQVIQAKNEGTLSDFAGNTWVSSFFSGFMDIFEAETFAENVLADADLTQDQILEKLREQDFTSDQLAYLHHDESELISKAAYQLSMEMGYLPEACLLPRHASAADEYDAEGAMQERLTPIFVSAAQEPSRQQPALDNTPDLLMN